MLVNNTVFLCGYFSAKKTAQAHLLKDWTQATYTEDNIAEMSDYYFPEFATFMTKDMKRYDLAVGKSCTLSLRDDEVPFFIEGLHLWFAPFNLVLYAVEIKFNQIDINQMTYSLNMLRKCSRYDEKQRDFVQMGMKPIVDIYNALTHSSLGLEGSLSPLIEPGNKLKIFQIIALDGPVIDDDMDYLLYDAGTLIKHTPNSLGVNSEDYYQSIMTDHNISVFNNWKGLALLDTFTILSYGTPDWVINNWKEDYFGKIYIYQLFRKVFLYNVNLSYRKRNTNVEVLEKQLDHFEQDYSYSSISYNFLPNLINTALEKSLETQQDNDQLYRMINKEMERRGEQAEEKTNKFLTFLTCLTIFSAIFDFTSLVNESFDYSQLFSDTMHGFRFVSLVVLFLVAIAYLVVIIRYQKRRS